MSDLIQKRQKVAQLIKEVLANKRSVANALIHFPKDANDKSIDVAFWALSHIEADEDIRKNDELYKEEQDNYIKDIAQKLSNGEALSINIINEYLEYYKETPIYPVINKKTILERLKKFINI